MYDAFGALAAEYSTAAQPANPTTSYLTTDLLGSPRVITDRQGNVISRRDFMPFGEEIGAGVGGRTEALKYSLTGADNVRQRFTGYEKDEETGLDFAEARMYRNNHGRFTAPDPLLPSASLGNPQTFNRYVYVGNDPVNVTDPAGLSWCRASNGDVEFTGVDKPRKPGWENRDGKLGTITRGDWSDVKGGAKVGDLIRYNRDGSVTVLDSSNKTDQEEIARETGTNVEAESNPIATIIGEIGSTISQRQKDPGPDLGCPEVSDSACGSGNHVNQSLVDGATAEEILDSAQIALDVASATEMPVISQAAGLVNAGIDVGKGDYASAGLGIVGLLPIAGNVADASRLARRTARLGREGELAVRTSYDIGSKLRIVVNGRTRIPDGLTSDVLSEVKNVKSLSFTRQLRDYSDFVGATPGIRFDLFVRPTTKLSKPLQEQVVSGKIHLRRIPE